MAVGVVERFEIVNIHHNQRELLVVALGTLDFLVQKELEIAVHIELGHAVGRGQFKKPRVFNGDGGLHGEAAENFQTLGGKGVLRQIVLDIQNSR